LADPALALETDGRRPSNTTYNPATEVRLQGRIASIFERPAKFRKHDAGYHLYLRDKEGQSYFVHLGPKSFFEDQNLQLAVGKNLQIIASEIELDGTRIYVARELKTDNAALMIRDRRGRPEFRQEPGIGFEGLRKLQ